MGDLGELLVAEESAPEYEPLGEAALRAYAERLAAAGVRRP